jgi:hypothetical protein
MKPPTRALPFGFAAALFLTAGSVSADQAAAPPPLPPPAPSNVPPEGVRNAPPPYAAPTPPEHREDTVVGPRATFGGYGAPSLKMTGLAGDAVMLVGGEGGLIIGSSVVVGAAGYSTVTNVVSPATLQPIAGDAHLGMFYGGPRLGGIVRPLKRTHLTLGVLVGPGRASSENPDGTYYRSETFWVVEPDLGAEVNLSYHARLGVVGSYRFVGGTSAVGFTSTRLSGPAAALTLRFGSF